MLSPTKHLEWIKKQPCLVRGCFYKADPHHVRTAANSGTGMKPTAYDTVPLCRIHHVESHRGARTFQRRYGLDLSAEAAFYARVSGTEMP